jgi:prepilin-type N-terminal cleavage/methylation domain-containing protein
MQTPLILTKKAKGSFGFTLVELLVVIAIIAIMAVLSGPALTAIINSGGVNRAVNGVSLTLEQARAYAMSHNTYVWVGFSDPTAQNQKLTVATVAGKTGTQNDLSATATFSSITTMQTYDNFILTSPNTAKVALVNPGMDTTADDVTIPGTPFPGMPFKMPQPGGGTLDFKYAVQFSPQGEATINGAASHWIQIVLQPVRGGIAANYDPNLSVIQVATLTGQVEIYRQ